MLEKWAVELMVARSLVSSSPAQNSFALLTFASAVEDRVDFCHGREAVVSDLTKLEAKDWRHYKGPPRHTALLDTLVAALDLLRPARVGDVVYLISDGGDNASRTHLSDVKALLLASGVRLFGLITIDAVAGRGRTPEEEGGAKVLQGLIEASGGDSLAFIPGENPLFPSYTPRPLTDRDRAIMSFASLGFGREISEFYGLTVKLPRTVNKARDWKLEVVDPTGGKNTRLRVIYPHQLAPCQ